MSSLFSSAFQLFLGLPLTKPSQKQGQDHLGSIICKDSTPNHREQDVEGQECFSTSGVASFTPLLINGTTFTINHFALKHLFHLKY